MDNLCFFGNLQKIFLASQQPCIKTVSESFLEIMIDSENPKRVTTQNLHEPSTWSANDQVCDQNGTNFNKHLIRLANFDLSPYKIHQLH